MKWIITWCIITGWSSFGGKLEPNENCYHNLKFDTYPQAYRWFKEFLHGHSDVTNVELFRAWPVDTMMIIIDTVKLKPIK